jgi:hypothetical protein
VTRQLFRTAVAVAVGAASAILALQTSSGTAAGSATYLIKRGDFARIPSVGWTCMVAPIPQGGGSHPALLCTTDRKPVRSLWISTTRVFIDTGHAPMHVRKGYLYKY